MNTAHLAEWIRWTGVVVAVAGALIATPDGVSEVRRHIRVPRWLVLVWRADYMPWPFNLHRGRDAKINARPAEATAHPGWPTATQPWDPVADDHRKIEVLHLQHELLLEDLGRFRDDTLQRFETAQADLRAAEAQLRATHEQMANELAQKDRRAAQIDARGLWPIGFGILLTGIPAELAYIHVLGIAVTAAAVVLTVTLAWAGVSSRRDDAARSRAAASGSPVP